VIRRALTTPAGRALGFGAAVVFAAWWSVTLFRERWAVRIPDQRHSYGIRVRGGVDLFFPPQLGWFVDHALWIFFALVIMTIVAEWVTRSRPGFREAAIGNDDR
jgi:hypothetical protein